MTNRFIHVADVHLDSPLAKVHRLDAKIGEQMREASRRSFESVVDLALEREVDAVMIAGDLFDGPIKDASAALWVEGQFKRLTRSNIPVALILGNHDAVSASQKVTQWPDGVHEFGTSSASTTVFEQAGLAVHGQSFGSRVQEADLAAKYPAAIAGMFNVGLLHTSLSSPGSHDPYAPTTISVLDAAGYDYWALGHIHLRSEQSQSESCYVGYSGNTQGRSVRETGAKGCQVVEYSDDGLRNIEFVATDCFRWECLSLNISNAERLGDIEDLLGQQMDRLHQRADGRQLAVRIELEGTTALHASLTRAGAIDSLSEQLGNFLRANGDFWLEAVRLRSMPIPQVKHQDVVASLDYLSRVAESSKKEALLREELENSLEELLKKARGELLEYGWSIESEAESETTHAVRLDQLLAQAENMLVSRLMGEDVA